MPLRVYLDALREADRKLADERHQELGRRMNESAHDRERIRNTLGTFVPRTEYDQALTRLGALERSLARIAGALAVIVLLASILGVLLRYLVG